MAIEETRKKITFVPFEIRKGREVDTRPAPTITINKGSMRFNATLINELGLNGKFIKLFYDPIKSVIGFQIKHEVSLQSVGKQWKMVKQNDKTGIWSISIGKLLKVIDPSLLEKKFSLLPVKKYVEANGMEKGTVYYFVELQDGETEKQLEEEIV